MDLPNALAGKNSTMFYFAIFGGLQVVHIVHYYIFKLLHLLSDFFLLSILFIKINKIILFKQHMQIYY